MILITIMKCKICNRDGNFIWDHDYYANTGKWRLYDKDSERPHECHTKKPKTNIPEMTLCPYCDPQTRKKISRTKIDAHIKQEHLGLGFD